MCSKDAWNKSEKIQLPFQSKLGFSLLRLLRLRVLQKWATGCRCVYFEFQLQRKSVCVIKNSLSELLMPMQNSSRKAHTLSIPRLLCFSRIKTAISHLTFGAGGGGGGVSGGRAFSARHRFWARSRPLISKTTLSPTESAEKAYLPGPRVLF